MNRTRPAWTARLAAMVGAALLATGLMYSIVAPAPAASAATSTAGRYPGYWLMASDGGVNQFNTANYGQLRGLHLNQPIVGGAAARGGTGYWMVATDGGIFPFGTAHFYGSTGNVHLNKPIVGMAPTPSGHGYWLVASDGGIFQFGDAHFFGSTGNVHLNKPIVGMAATPDGRGYWLVASDGGIFQFGDAHFFGSTGNVRLNRPIVGMAADGTAGYWLVASDGGIFQFGHAPFYGSTGEVRLNQPIVGMAPDGTAGYWLVARDGGLFEFGHAPFLGSTGSNPGPAPVVTIATTPVGFPFLPGGIGYDVSHFQCGQALPPAHAISIVQVSSGHLDSPPNPCYAAEARWAGVNMSAYIFMNNLPNPAPPEALSGPSGPCNGNLTCESFNFGAFWAVHWVAYSRSIGIDPSFWWVDVELGGFAGRTQASNASVIAGAIAGLRASGVVAGIYSTSYQWAAITGNSLNYPGIALWIPGAGNLTGPGYTATNYCASAAWAPRFAGGSPVLVQWGYAAGGYTGPPSGLDLDYACV